MLWWTLYYGWFLSEILFLLVTRTRQGAGKLSDRGSLVLLWVVISASITACKWVASVTPQNIFAGAEWLRTASVVVIALGLAIRWTAVLSLGKSFSVNVAVHRDQRVYKRGLYRVVRHPSYLGLMVVFLAIGIRSGNWYSLAIIMVFPMAALIYRIRVEEAALTDAFGEEYLAYARATKRLLPLIY